MSNQLPCGEVQIERGVTFRAEIEATDTDGTAFDFGAAGLTNSAIFYTGIDGDVVVTCATAVSGTDLIITLTATQTAALDVGNLWLQVRTQNESGFVWQFVKGTVNVY